MLFTFSHTIATMLLSCESILNEMALINEMFYLILEIQMIQNSKNLYVVKKSCIFTFTFTKAHSQTGWLKHAS